MINKHICMVNMSLAQGGAQKASANLSLVLSQKGHTISHVVLNDLVVFEHAGRVFNLGAKKHKKVFFWHRLHRFYLFWQIIKKSSFDVIIDHRTKQQWLIELLYALVYRLSGSKIIYVVHNSDYKQYLTNKPQLLQRIYNQNIATVGVSQKIVTDLQTHYNIKNTKLLYNPILLNKNSKVSLDNRLIGKQYFLYYGRMYNEQKDLIFLLNAFELSELYLESIYLVLLGDGPDKELLQNYAKGLKSNHHILFFDFTKHIEPFILNCQAVVMTSHYEGFPLTLMEANAMKKPIVTIDFDYGPKEIIEHGKNGFLINERNEALFGTYLKKALTYKNQFSFEESKDLFDNSQWADFVTEICQ